MRILVLTSLFPNSVKPSHGIFVENRLRAITALAKTRQQNLDIRVIAPVPWFPSKAKIFRAYANYAKIPLREWRYGVDVRHPRYLVPPKIGMGVVTSTLTACFKGAIQQLLDGGWDFDLIDAHYYYPDGVAAVNVAHLFNKPVIVTARGSDITQIANFSGPREKILSAAERANASISVCGALRKQMIALGMNGDKIHTLRNGVDLDRYHPQNITPSHRTSTPAIASVGHLIDRKGHDLVIRAVAEIDRARLLVVGDGPEEKKLKSLVQELNIADRVSFTGALHPDQLPDLYNRVDMLALGSDREGWPNVLLEAMACGTPCIAFDIGGNAEVIRAPEAGRILGERSASALRDGLNDLFANLPDRKKTRLYAEQFSWQQTAAHILDLWEKTIQPKTIKKPQPVWHTVGRFPPSETHPPLLVTIDTEEIFNWADGKSVAYCLSPIEDFAPFQALCEQYGIQPHYFLTWPLLRDSDYIDWFHALHTEGRASLGLHLHAWQTPPEDALKKQSHLYQSQMPHTLHFETLKTLADQFERVFGFRATTHRAGRYGIAPFVLDHLAEIGVRHDFSPSAGFDFRPQGGPNFSALSADPFFHKTGTGKLLSVIPPSGARALKRTRLFFPTNENHMANFADLSLGQKHFSAPMRLTPEGNNIADMIALAKALNRQHVSMMSLSLHSSSLSAGANPYARNSKEVEALLHRLDQFFKWQNANNPKAFLRLQDIDAIYSGFANSNI